MTEGRTTQQRKADVLAALERNGEMWLATAGRNTPQLIAISGWWNGSQLTMATIAGSRTARNLDASKVARVGLGTPDDVVMIDVAVSSSTPVSNAAALRTGFKAALGWDPADEGPNWVFYALRPVRIQAYRGYGEQHGRDVMRDSRWLA